MSYGESPICDYVTLYFADRTSATITGDLIFDISPSAYMFQDRGQYCLVSMADGSYFQNTEDESVTVGYKNVSNQGSSDITQPAILGVFTQVVQHSGAGHYKHQFFPNKVKYLTQPRPTQIVITLREANAAKTGKTFDSGFVTLKFEYLSKTQVALMNEDVATNVAF
jgi:hypothetical protein